MNDQNAQAGLDSEVRHEAPHWLRTLTRLAWLPIPLLTLAIIAARVMGLSQSYPNETLTLILSVVFYTLVSLGTVFLIGRSFLTSGRLGLLLLECGVILWSLSGTVGDIVSDGDANVNVTIFNMGILVAAGCHLAGATFSLRPQSVLRAKRRWLVAGGVLTLGVLWLIAQAALANKFPVFFVPGQGGTPVRYWVLISTIVMIVLSARLLYAGERRTSPFTSWYASSLLLLAVGLLGIMIQLSLGSVVNWLSRTAQWLSGVYLFISSIAALRQLDLPLFPPLDKARQKRHPYIMAVSIVISAAALRFVLSPVIGAQHIFLIFYPALILSALYGGIRAALLSMIVSAAIIGVFWMEPVGQFTLSRPADWVSLLLFFLGGTMISFIVEAMHEARDRLTLHQDHLEELVRDRTAKLESEVAVRERAEEDLREGQERLQLTLQASAVGTFEVDLTTGLGRWNAVEYELLGLRPGDAPGDPDTFFRYVHPQDVAELRARWDEATRTGRFAAEFRVIRADGQERWLAGKGQFMLEKTAEAGSAGGKKSPMRFLGVNIDITERKRAEEALRKAYEVLDLRVKERTAQLECKNKELQEFTYVASHDLSEPLRKIQTFGDLLETKGSDRLGEKERDYVSRMMDAAKRMQELLDALLRYSRIETHGRDFVPVKLEEIVQIVMSDLEIPIKKTAARVEIGPLPVIDGDPYQLRQLFQNLIANALKYYRSEVKTVIKIYSENNSGHAHILVEDYGIGFDEKYLDKIFQPFQRLHGRNEYPGTGVGLAICKKIIDRHHGSITAKSTPGKGSTFIITLPLDGTIATNGTAVEDCISVSRGPHDPE